MGTKLKFRRFNHHKDISELVYEFSHWTTDLEFIKLELDFIKHLLKSYPFEKNSFNLFERIQLYIQRIESLHRANTDISKGLAEYENILTKVSENKTLFEKTIDPVKHEDLAESVFEYKQEYIDFKSEVYEYIHGIIN